MRPLILAALLAAAPAWGQTATSGSVACPDGSRPLDYPPSPNLVYCPQRGEASNPPTWTALSGDTQAVPDGSAPGRRLVVPDTADGFSAPSIAAPWLTFHNAAQPVNSECGAGMTGAGQCECVGGGVVAFGQTCPPVAGMPAPCQRDCKCGAITICSEDIAGGPSDDTPFWHLTIRDGSGTILNEMMFLSRRSCEFMRWQVLWPKTAPLGYIRTAECFQ